MKRAEIRREVDLALAAKGFAIAHRTWVGCELVVRSLNQSLTLFRVHHSVRLPSGISRKRFIEAIEAIEAIGSPRPAPIYERADTMRQADIEDYLGGESRH